MATENTSLLDLPFVRATADGHTLPWDPLHPYDTYAEAYTYGLTCAAALVRFACVDAQAALHLVIEAMRSDVWDMECGEEQGFVDGLAQAAVAGWRQRAQSAAH